MKHEQDLDRVRALGKRENSSVVCVVSGLGEVCLGICQNCTEKVISYQVIRNWQ